MFRFTQERPSCVCDSECYVNYWSIGFRCLESGRQRVFEFFDGNPLDRAGIAKVLRKWRLLTFNGNGYDMPMIMLAMQPGVTNEFLKRASDEIIMTRMSPWKFYERHNLSVPDFIDHIDLMEVSPGAPQKISLKMSAARLHSKWIRELPFDPSHVIQPENRLMMNRYLANDLISTSDLAKELKPQLDLRHVMSVEYGVDLRSKSDAQIAEAVIKSEVEKVMNRRLYRPDVQPHIFKYEPPPFIGFKSQWLRQMLHDIKRTEFVVREDGVVEMPKYLSDKKIQIGNGVYRMGIGGLHSSEESVTHVSDDEFVLLDRDVASYYPAIIIGQKLYPKHIGPVFLKIYESIRTRRLEAKRAKQKNVAESLKIVLNGSFGKFGSPYSVLYAPNLMIQTTLTGQLALLMQIEQLEDYGIEVISANTDGIVSKVPRHMRWKFNAAFRDWEWDTGYETEETEYRSLHSSSVNTYLAVKPDGAVKAKGVLTEGGPGQPGASGLKKNPAAEICAHAVREYLSKGTPIERTIHTCEDVRKFVVVRRVNGGAHKNGREIGKVVRWYYSTQSPGPLQYIKDNKNVPRSDGAEPLMELPDFNECPDDLDRSWYVREAYAILQDVGYGTIDPSLKGRTGTFLGRLPDEKNIHMVDAKTGLGLCGKTRKSLRDAWIEYNSVPAGHRMCAKCRKELEL